jgi:hypothetical protein
LENHNSMATALDQVKCHFHSYSCQNLWNWREQQLFNHNPSIKTHGAAVKQIIKLFKAVNGY